MVTLTIAVIKILPIIIITKANCLLLLFDIHVPPKCDYNKGIIGILTFFGVDLMCQTPGCRVRKVNSKKQQYSVITILILHNEFHDKTLCLPFFISNEHIFGHTKLNKLHPSAVWSV